MDYVVKEVKKIMDGEHVGVIVNIEERVEPYEYVDLSIEFDGLTMRVGYPATISEISNLGKLMQRFGAELAVGQKLDPQKTLIGRKCVFVTRHEDGKPFARIIQDSVRPAE